MKSWDAAVGAFGGVVISWWLTNNHLAMVIGACLGIVLVRYCVDLPSSPSDD